MKERREWEKERWRERIRELERERERGGGQSHRLHTGKSQFPGCCVAASFELPLSLGTLTANILFEKQKIDCCLASYQPASQLHLSEENCKRSLAFFSCLYITSA